jgi:hypothetical protein
MKRVAAGVAVFALVAVTAITGSSAAQSRGAGFDFYSGGAYTPGVPRPEEHLGYAIGTRHSYYHQYEAYLEKLAQSPAAPRMKVESYGTSYEGRKLYLVFVSSEENIARLESIRAEVARLRDPRATGAAEARRIAAATPAIAWMNFANDGNESAAFETAFQMTYQLAAGEDETTRRIRAEVVTIIVPAHNPESHERFVAWYNAVAQRGGNPDPEAAEHHGDWLMDSNDNHYQIDLNRDAFALTQRESQAIVRQIQRWNPQVFVDFHGNPPVFYFPPVARPVNRNLGETYDRGERFYGRAIAEAFDRYGWTYMNREVFDLFYPGYFDSYPSLNGAIGMTFETDGGGNQGLRRERGDGTESSLREAAAKHFTGGMATLAATAEHRAERLADFYEFRRSGMEEAEREPMKQVVLVEGADRARVRELVALLLEHGVEVYRAPRAFRSARAHNYVDETAAAREFPAGAWVIPLAQPQKRLAKTLLEPEAELEEDFVREEMAKRERNATLGRDAGKEPVRFYDTTAWSLPLTFGVEAWWTEDRAANLERVDADWLAQNRPGGGVEGPDASRRYGYLFRYDSNAAAKLLAQLLKEEFRAAVLRTAVEAGGETFPPGSILLRAERNPTELDERIAVLAGELGVRVRAVEGAWTEAGPTLGSGRIEDLKMPRVAIATNVPTNGRAYGSLWFLFEQVLDYPFTPIRTDRLRRADLSKYDVLIFPDGGDGAYEELLGAQGVARIKQWIENGGTFVGIRGGAAFATREKVGWTTSRLAGRSGAEGEKPVERTPGAFLRVWMNAASYLTFGYDTSAAPEVVMHNSAYIFSPSKEGTNAVSYAKEKPRVSGFIWPDTEERIAGTPYLIAENVGRGQVILFADDPNFRLYWPRLTRLFLNAVFFAPSLR